MSIREKIQDVFYIAGGVVATEMIGLNGMVYSASDSPMVRDVKTGIILTAIDEVINYIRYGTTWALRGDYYMTLDNAFFNTVSWSVLMNLGVVERVWQTTDQLGLPSNVSNAVGSGLVKVSMKSLQSMVESYGNESQLSYLTHWFSKLMQYR